MGTSQINSKSLTLHLYWVLGFVLDHSILCWGHELQTNGFMCLNRLWIVVSVFGISSAQ